MNTAADPKCGRLGNVEVPDQRTAVTRPGPLAEGQRFDAVAVGHWHCE